MSALTAEENDWVFDYVMNVFRSPAWEVPVLCFIDEHCAVFDAEDENKFVHSELHEQFRELVERVLSDNLAEIGLSAADFADVCERSRGSSGGGDDASMDVVNQILAMDDFLTFKKLMVKRNLELELEAIRALRDEVADDATADASARDMEAHLMELSVLYKQEEMEQAELEAALAMSLSVQEEELRRASVASKTAEDKFADPTTTTVLSPEEAHRQLRESKKKAEEICKKNKEALAENRSKQREWQQAAEISEAELRRREEYLRKQRDLLVEKKRKERETQLKEFRQETKETPPEPPAQLVEKIQSTTPEELKKAEVEERRAALRLALARRMKQDLLDSAAPTDDADGSCGGFRAQQVVELDGKLQRVEELRRKSQEREQKLHARLAGGLRA